MEFDNFTKCDANLSGSGCFDPCNGTVDGGCVLVDPYSIPTTRKILWSLFFFLMVATADIGNIIVIWIVMSNARMRSVTNYFIINLSMADIINATFNVIPNFTYMLTGNWPFGLVFCKLGGYISILSVSVSVLTLVAISVDRYNAIIKPLKPRMSKLKTMSIAIIIWGLGLTFGIPMVIFFTTTLDPEDPMERTRCISEWPDASQQFESKLEYGYNVWFMIMTYFLPMMSMSFTYSRVGLSLWGSRAIGEFSEAQAESIRSKRKVVKMMMGVVTLFLVCWLPYHTYFITANLYPAINYSHYIQEIYLMIYWLAMSNSMYNPMIYCYMNQRFRDGFLKVLDKFLCKTTNRESVPKFKLSEISKGKIKENSVRKVSTVEYQNQQKLLDGSARTDLAPLGHLRVDDNWLEPQSLTPSPTPSDNSVFPEGSQSPSPPILRANAKTLMNVHTFLNRAKSRVMRVDRQKLQVKLSESTSSPCLSPAAILHTKEKLKSVHQEETDMGVVERTASTSESQIPDSVVAELTELQIGSNKELL